MTTIFPQVLRCPDCKTEFNASVIGSYGTVGSHTDLCPEYSGAPALFHLLATCPNCRFTAYLDRFDDLGNGGDDFDDIVDEGLPEEPLEPWGPAKFLEAVKTYTRFDKNNRILGDLFLKAYWCFHFGEFPDVEASVCLSQAIFYFIESLAKDELPPDEKPEYIYLVGELSRRAGRFVEAAEWFDKVAGLDPPEDLLKLSRRMKTLAEKGDSSDKMI